MKPVLIIAILLLVILSAYVLFIGKTIEESEGFGQLNEADLKAAIELTSMNGPGNFGGFPNQIGQSGNAMSSNPLIQYKMNSPSVAQTTSAISQPVKPITTECKFDAAAYSKFYPDLQKAFNGDAEKLKTHYKTYGLKEGRTPCGATLPTCKFDAAAYSSYYPDLQKAFNGNADQLKNHYINNGINENRNVCKVTK